MRIAPGVHVNLSKGGASVSLGGRGAWYTISRGGRRRTTVGVPGTGISFTRVSRVPATSGSGAPVQRSAGARFLRSVLIAAAVYLLLALLVVIIGGALLSR